MITIKETIDRLRQFDPKAACSFYSYCRDNSIPCEKRGGEWLIDEDFISEAIDWRKSAFDIDKYLKEKKEWNLLSDWEKKQCYRSVHNKMRPFIETDCEAILFRGNLVSSTCQISAQECVNECVQNYINKNTMVPISDAAKKMNISVYQVEKLNQKGAIKVVRVKNDRYVSHESINEFVKKANSYIGVYDYTLEITKNMRTVFDVNDHIDRALLNNYLKASSLKPILLTWEQAELHGDRRNALYFPLRVKEEMKGLIMSFIKRYGLKKERLDMLKKDPYWETHKETAGILDLFSKKKTAVGMAALLECLIECVKPEIINCTNEDIDNLIRYTENSPAKIYGTYVARFLKFVKENYECKFTTYTSVDYGHKVNSNTTRSNASYSFSEYMLGAHMVFNNDYIKEHNLINKAMESPRYSWIWLHMAWQYIAAWRDSDFVRLPIINLLHDKQFVKKQIIDDQYGADSKRVCMLLEHEINELSMKPHKTQEEQEQHFLVLRIPESLKSTIGTIYSICCVHASGEKLGKQSRNSKDYYSFFGPDYVKVFGNRVFLNRKANKAFLDEIVEITEKESGSEHKFLGYVVASYARAHASAMGKIASTTSRYLNCKLDGLEPDEILMLLWDAGPCSFVPYMLLESVYGKDFSMLTVKQQAEIMKIADFTAFEAESASMIVRNAYINAQSLTDKLLGQFKTFDDRQKFARNVIYKLINNEAVGKQIGTQCWMSVMRKPCIYKKKDDCIGCKHVIYETAFIFVLEEKLKDAFVRRNKAKTEGERQKWQRLIDDVYLPAIYEVLAFAKIQYNIDIDVYKNEILQIMAEGQDHVVYSNEDDERDNKKGSANKA